MLACFATLIAHIASDSSAPSKCSIFPRCSVFPATCIAFSFSLHYLLLPITDKNAIVTQIKAVIITAVQFICFLLINSCGRWATSMLFVPVHPYNLHQSILIHTAVDSVFLAFHFQLVPTLSSCDAALHGVLCTHRLEIHYRYWFDDLSRQTPHVVLRMVSRNMHKICSPSLSSHLTSFSFSSFSALEKHTSRNSSPSFTHTPQEEGLLRSLRYRTSRIICSIFRTAGGSASTWLWCQVPAI